MAGRIKKTVTIEDVMAMRPCISRDEIAAIFGKRKRLGIADLKAIPREVLSIENRLWLLLREDFIPAKELHLLACRFAEAALKRERKSGREPSKDSWNAISVKRRWVKGLATYGELAEASAAAWDAAWAAWAARAAAWAARDAAWAEARAAARDAAWAAWAARAAAWAARDAAWAAARAAARAAAWAAWDAASDVARAAQYKATLRVLDRLHG